MAITYLQIQQIKKYLKEIENLQTVYRSDEVLYDETVNLDSRISSSVKDYNPQGINWDSASGLTFDYEGNATSWYSRNEIIGILKIMDAALQGVLLQHTECAEIMAIIDLIDEGSLLVQESNEASCEDYVRKVTMVHPEAFSGEQLNYLHNTFDKSLSNIPQILVALDMYLIKLGKGTLSTPRNTGKEVKKETNSTVNFHITANGGSASADAMATSQVKIDFALRIENVREDVKNACLREAEEKEILSKLAELEEIVKEKNKPKRWQKLKSIFKWIAEQSLQVASWVVPLIYTAVSAM